jgi:predicted nucleotidyltransferase
MIGIIEDKRAEIEALCRRYGIRKLELFGSAATGAFDPATSDLDFIVDLGAYEQGVSHRFLGFADALEALFGRPVDVITEPSNRNPYFRAEVDETRQPVSAATDREAVV